MLRPLFTAIAIWFLAGVLGAQQAAPSGKQVRVMKLYVQTLSGALSEVPRESAFPGQETIRDLPNGVATPSNVVNVLRVPGPQAKIRFTVAVPIELWAEMPADTDPRQLELYHFGVHGKQRLTYVEPFRNPRHGVHWNTISFRAGLLKDGRWKLMPPALPAGEYCFVAWQSIDDFCFGVDPK
jgi:hypothetical protein